MRALYGIYRDTTRVRPLRLVAKPPRLLPTIHFLFRPQGANLEGLERHWYVESRRPYRGKKAEPIS